MLAKPHKKICFHRIVAHDILSFAKLSSCEMCWAKVCKWTLKPASWETFRLALWRDSPCSAARSETVGLRVGRAASVHLPPASGIWICTASQNARASNQDWSALPTRFTLMKAKPVVQLSAGPDFFAHSELSWTEILSSTQTKWMPYIYCWMNLRKKISFHWIVANDKLMYKFMYLEKSPVCLINMKSAACNY